MNWEAVGAVAEMVAALGVIGSLLYLGFQIRAQNRESRLNAVHNTTDQYNSFIGDLATNQGLAEVFLKGSVDMTSLDQVETLRYSSQLGRTFRIVESMYAQHTSGVMDKETWEAMTHGIEDVCSLPGVRSWWPTRSHWYIPAFQSFIQPMIDDEGVQRLYKSENV